LIDAQGRRTGGGSTGIDFPVVPSFIGTAVSGGCGCVAFLAGAALAIALFAPQFLSGYGARVLQRDLGRILDAEVEVEDVRLAWRGPQTAGRVRVLAPDGAPMLEGSLTLPSMFALFGGGGGRGAFGIRVDRLVARVDGAGGSDLARALRVDVDAGETVLSALRGLVMDLARGRDLEPERRGDLRFDVRVAEGRFVGPDGDEVRIDDLGFSARSHRLGAVLQLSSFGVTAPGRMEGAARARMRATFDAEGRLVQASADVDPIPADVLRAIGWLPRSADPAPLRARPRGLHARGGLAALDLVADVVEPGARIRVRFGDDAREPDRSDGGVLRGADGPEGPRRLRLTLESADATFEVDGLVSGAGDRAVLRSTGAPGSVALYARGPFPGEAFADLLRPLAPAGVHVEGFTLPDDGRPSVFEAASRGLEVPLGPLAAGLTADALEDVLRAARLDLDVSAVRTAARMAPVAGAPPSDGAPRISEEPDDQLIVQHLVTRLALRPGGRLEVLSRWRTGSKDSRSLSSASIESPGVGAPAVLDLEVSGMPRSLLVAASDLPGDVAALFYGRLHRVTIGGLPIATILNRGSLVPAEGLRVRIDPADRPGESLDGELRNGAFRCDRARFVLSLGDGAVRRTFFEGMMPWLRATRAAPGAGGREPGRVEVLLEDLEVDLATGRDRSARVTLRSEPLQVQMHRGLAQAIGLGVDTEDRWLTWAPPTMQYVVRGGSIEYVDVDVPLEDEESARMSGNSNARGSYILRGEVERRLLTDSRVRGIVNAGSEVDLETLGIEVLPVRIDAPTRDSVELLFNPRVLELLLTPLGVDPAGR